MYDMHYDLLTILYQNLKENNPKADKEKITRELIPIYHSNIKGGIVNLYFMSKAEMFDELGITEEEINNVYQMFKQSIKYLESFKNCGIIPSDIDYIYGIEGCDFLKDEKDLEPLYELGLRSIIPVWNNENKFGSGNRSEKGLTELGVKLIEKAIELGIIIDVSHANEKTFYDIIKIIDQNKNKKVNLIASHSNVRSLCDRDRNLTDGQLKTLKNHNGYIGLFTNGNFISKNNKDLTYNERLKNFIRHLRYLIEKIDFNTKKIIISTDDMNLNPNQNYHNIETYPLGNIYRKLYMTMLSEFGQTITEDILTNNSKKLIAKIKNFQTM